MLTDATNDDQIIEEWLVGKADSTKDEYQRDLEQFRSWAGDHKLQDIRPVVLQKWEEELRERYEVSTATRKIQSLKSLLTYAHKTGYIEDNPGRLVQPGPVPNRFQEHILPPEDVRDIIESTESFFHRTVLMTLYGLGLRASELVHLHWDDLLVDQKVKVRSSKRGFDRVIPVPDGIWEDWHQLQNTEGPIFQADGKALTTFRVWEITKEALARSSVDGDKYSVSPHWFRHCHATHALNNGAPISLIRIRLGHQSIETTKLYLHAEDGASGDYLETLDTFYGDANHEDTVRDAVEHLAEQGVKDGEIIEMVEEALANRRSP